MEATMRTQLLNYCKVGDAEATADGVIESLYKAAVELGQRATGKAFLIVDHTPQSETYWLAIMMLVAHWYDHRGLVDDSKSQIPLSAQSIFDFIALCSDYESTGEANE